MDSGGSDEDKLVNLLEKDGALEDVRAAMGLSRVVEPGCVCARRLAGVSTIQQAAAIIESDNQGRSNCEQEASAGASTQTRPA